MFQTIRKIFCKSFNYHSWKKTLVLDMFEKDRAKRTISKEVCRVCNKMRVEHPGDHNIRIERKAK